MKIWAVVLVILSLTKLCIAFSQDRSELVEDLIYQLLKNLDDFQKKAILILAIDGIIGIICSIIIMCSL